jgi:16S rRNA processing protein RimM
MNREGYFQIGRLVKAHGLKGTFQVLLQVNNAEDYLNLESIFVEHQQKLIPFFISDFTLQNNERAYLTLEEITTKEKAQTYQNAGLYIKEEHMSDHDLDNDSLADIIGYNIIDERLGELGPITDYYEKVGQDLIAFEYKNQEVLIPVDDDIVLEIDDDRETISTRIPEGLLEIYMSDHHVADDGDDEN